MLEAVEKYAVIEGRSNRKEFWLFYLLAFPLHLFVSILNEPLFGVPILSILLVLFLITPAITLCIRRLHDLDASGWWCLTILIPLIGIFIWLFIGIAAGTEKKNRFGARPKG